MSHITPTSPISTGTSSSVGRFIVVTDSGVATVSAGVLNIFGAQFVSTSATGNTVTVTSSGLSSLNIQTNNGTATPSSGTISILGAGPVTTTGVGSVVSVNVTRLPVSAGGTGRTVLTSFGVLLGEGSNAINTTNAGTNGQLLIGATGADPQFNALTSSGQTLSFTAGANALNIEVNQNSSFFNPLKVPNGGTGRTVLTTSGVLLGEGSGNVNVTNAGTNGQLLIGGTGTDPIFNTLTSSGQTLSFTAGSGTLNIEVNPNGAFFNPLKVPNGGTGRTVLTTSGVLLGEGSGNVNVTAPGTNGQLLIGGTGVDPIFNTLTSSSQTLSFTAGSGTLNIEVNTSVLLPNPLLVPNGGTGRTVLTTSGVLLGEGSGNVNVTNAGTNGQLLIGGTGTDPIFNTLTSSSQTLSFTAGSGTLNIEVNTSVLLPNPLLVPNGGTGRTVLTTSGVLLGEGSGNVNVTNAGTNGQLLIGGTGTDPIFNTLTSSGQTLSFTAGAGTLNIEVNPSGLFFNPLKVPNGGTGRTVLTSFGVLLGEGSNNINVTNAGTNGQLLIGGTGTDPKFSTVTSSLLTLTFAVGSGTLNIDLNAPVTVPFGGTGRTVLTSSGVLLGEGSGNVNVTAPGTNGQLLIGGTGTDPIFNTLTSSSQTLSFTAGSGTLNIEVNSGSPFFNPLQVPNGGTGRTVLTSFGVLLGEGSNNINVTNAGTNGQILIGGTGTDPKFSTVTSSLLTLTFAVGSGTLNIDLNAPVTVPFGGTGRTVLTSSGVLLGEGSGNVNVTAPGTDGQLLIGGTGTDPVFGTLTSSGQTLSFTAGPGTLNIEVNPSGLFFNPLKVPNGGTGRTVLTSFGVLLGEGSNNINVTNAGTNGQLLIGGTGTDPKFSTVTSSLLTLTFAVGSGTLNIDLNAPVTVPFGGTGRTVLTSSGVLLGEGSGNVNVTAPGTNGQLLIGGTGTDPIFNTLTSSSQTLSFTAGSGTLNIEVNSGSPFFNPLQVPNGGTGRTVLTSFGVLLGEGSNNINVTNAGTNGQLLIGGTGTDPKFSTVTSSLLTLTFAVGSGTLNIDLNAPVTVPFGGTGQTVLTTSGVLLGEGSGNVNVTAPGTDGQLLIGGTGTDPVFGTLTSSGQTLSFTAGAGTLNIEVNSGSPFFNPLQVPNGGTGRTVLTSFGVLLGEGSNNINVTNAGTNGQLLIGGTGTDPKFSTVTSSLLTLTFAVGSGTLNIDLNAPVTVPFGGTGQTVLTTSGVLLGEGSGNVNVTAPGTDGQLLIGGTGTDPVFGTLTSSGQTLSFTAGAGTLNIEVNSSSPFFNPLQVPNGGTGRTVLTSYGVLLGEGSGSINVTAPGTDGQLLIGGTGTDPVFGTLTSSGQTLSFTAGAGTLNIEVNSGSPFFNPLQVPNGGTGRTVLTSFGVLLGEGSNNINVTNAGTNGQLLIGGTGTDPKFNTVTSSLLTLTFAVGSGTLNIDLNAPVTVPFGGTGQTVLTTSGVLLGEGSGSINVTAPGTDGQLLIGGTGTDPVFGTLTSSGQTLSFTAGAGTLNIEVNSGSPFFNPLQVPNGGTGRTVLTSFGVLLGEGSNNINVTNAGTDGQLLIGGTGTDPKFSTVTSSLLTLTFAVGSGTLNIDLNAPVTVPFGGTGQTVLTTSGVLLGEGSGSINVTAPGTDGQLLIGGTGTDPVFGTLTSSSQTLSFTAGSGTLNIEVNTSAFIPNPLPVPNGGTGRTVLTSFGVLLGEGSNNINVTNAGTNGQLLIGGTGTDPKFNTVTSSLLTLTFAVGSGTLNIDLNAPVTVPFGGTGQTVLTTSGVLLGEGSGSINVTAPGTDGQLLIGGTGTDPVFGTLTSSGQTLSFTAGAGTLNIEVNSGSPFFNPLQVPNGGTGRTVLTSFGVLLGEGSNNINVTNAGTDGQLLIGGTGTDPQFGTVTSSLLTLTFAVGSGTLNIDLNAPVTVPFGGTGQTVLTTSGVLLGEGSGSVNVTAPGTDGQLLIGGTGTDPVFGTLTSSGQTLSFTAGSGTLNIEVNSSSPFFNPLQVPNGGTGRTVLTSFGVLLGEGSNNINVTNAGTDGQLLIGGTGTDPQFGTVTSSLGTLTFAAGSGTLNIDLNAPVTVPFGGTGQTVLTTSGVLLGEGSGSVNVTAPGTDGQLLIGGTGTDPVFGTLTSSGQTLSFTAGSGTLNIEVNSSSPFFKPLQVPNGGTGRTVLTSFGVLLGEGSNNINVTNAGTDGQLLIGGTGTDPQFGTVTSSLLTLTFAVGSGTLNIDLNAPVTVPFGGTGQTVLTTSGVLLGEGSGSVNVTAPGTDGQLLIGGTGTDPIFNTLTSSGQTLSFTAGSGTLNIEVNSSSPFFNPLQVPNGGTGRTVLTSFGVLLGEGSNNINVTNAGTDGQLLIGGTGTDPQFGTVTSSLLTLTFAVGSGTLNIDLNAPVTVPFGGTGQTVLTTSGVLLGEGSGSVNVTAPGTDGQLLIGGTGTDPVFGTLTSSGQTLSFTAGSGTLNIEVNSSSPFFNPLQVPNGGTGRTVLTSFGVLLGEGSNNINVTNAGTDGQLLIGGTGTDPQFGTVTSSLGTLTFAAGSGTLNIDLNAPVTVPFGGTGQTVLTTSGVLLGEGSGSVNVTAPGTDGQLLIGGTGTDPVFGTLTSSGQTLSFTAGSGTLNIEVNSSSPFFNPLQVPNGGTGRTVLTSFGVLLGEGSNNINVTNAGTDGQLLIGGTGTDPQFGTVTSSLGTLTFAAGSGTLNIDLNAPVTVPFGGTGQTVLTTSGVLLGEGSGSVNVTAPGTDGQLLIGGTGTDPVFGTLTSSGQTLSFTAGSGTLNIEVNSSSPFFNPLQVPNGGTGRTVLTSFGVLLGEGSNNINVTNAGTDGQLLIGGTGTDPQFGTVTSSLGTLTFAAGSGTLNIDLNAPVTVPFGGTGQTVLTTSGVLLGEGSGSVNVTAPGTDGQLLIGGTGTDPVFGTLTSSGQTLSFTAGSGTLNIEVNSSSPFFNPLQVPNGGTGRTVLTSYGVLLGEGSNNINVTNAGTDGQLLIGGTGTDPQFGTVTSSLGTLTFAAGSGTLNIDLNAPVTVPFGGTGQTVLTTSGVLLGEGSGNVNVTAPGTDGQLLIGGTGTDPVFGTLTSSGQTLSFTAGSGTLNIEVNSSSPFFNPLQVPNGGTGRTVLTSYGVLLGEGSNNINVTNAGTDGQLLIGGTGTDPQFGTVTSSLGTLTFAAGSGTLNIDLNAPVTVPFGGTGQTVLTTSGVLLGEGSGSVNVTAPGTDGQLLIGGTGTDPIFNTLTSSGQTLSFIAGSGTLNIEVNTSMLLPNPLLVPNGGTGRTVLTSFGVLLGEGSNNINVTNAGTDGQLLIGGTGTDPQFGTVTSSLLTLTFAVGSGTLNIDLNAPVTVPFGGTGQTVLTTSGVLLGEGSGNVNVTAPGTDGQLLIGGTGTDPVFGTLTSSGQTLSFTAGSGTLNIEVNSSSPFFNPLQVPNGGTGRTVLTSYGVLLGEGSNNINVTNAGTDGQLLIGATGTDPAFNTLTSSGQTLTFTVGPNTLNIEVVSTAGFQWSARTTSGSLSAGHGYLCLSPGGALVFSFPSSPAVGDQVALALYSATSWQIALSGGQLVQFGNASIASSLTSSSVGDSVFLVCTVGGINSEWIVINSIGNITII